MAMRNTICFGVFIVVFTGCAGFDPDSRKDCTSYREQVYTQHVCAEVTLDCEYDLSGRQMCRPDECAREVPRLATRRVCAEFVCKEGFVRHSDDNCYTPEELSEMKATAEPDDGA